VNLALPWVFVVVHRGWRGVRGVRYHQPAGHDEGGAGPEGTPGSDVSVVVRFGGGIGRDVGGGVELSADSWPCRGYAAVVVAEAGWDVVLFPVHDRVSEWAHDSSSVAGYRRRRAGPDFGGMVAGERATRPDHRPHLNTRPNTTNRNNRSHHLPNSYHSHPIRTLTICSQRPGSRRTSSAASHKPSIFSRETIVKHLSTLIKSIVEHYGTARPGVDTWERPRTFDSDHA